MGHPHPMRLHWMSNTVRKVADIMIVVAGKAFMFKLLCEYLDDGRQDLLADPLSTIDRLNGPIIRIATFLGFRLCLCAEGW